MTTATSAPRTAVNARKRSVWAAPDSVRTVRNRGAKTASRDAPNVRNCVVKTALKKVSVQPAKKKWRTTMKNKKHKSLQSTKTKIQANLKQAQQKSNLLAERKAEHTRKLALRFSPTAWAKLLYFRDKSDNEVGGFGITKPDDLLFVKDFITVKQEVTCVSVKFDDEAVANFFEDQVDLGKKPEEFARIWLHSHPGSSPVPSDVDEETFTRVFGACQWAVMLIVAQNDKTYAKLSFNVGPGGQVLIPVEIDYANDFGPSNQELWDAEYAANIAAVEWLREQPSNKEEAAGNELSRYALPCDFINEFEQMEPAERQFILDELAESPELWEEESEVMFL